MSPITEPGESIDTIESASAGQLEVLGRLDSDVAQLLWQPNDGQKVLTVSTDSRIHLWDFNKIQVTNQLCLYINQQSYALHSSQFLFIRASCILIQF